MLPTSQKTEAAIAVIDARNIEEAVKTAIQTAKILTEEQKQLALQILNMKKLDVSTIEELIRRNTKKDEEILVGDMILPPGVINDQIKSAQAQWEERIGNIEDVLNGNMTVYDMVIQEQKRQKAIHEASKSVAQVAQQTIQFDRQNLEDARKALQASNESEGQHQAIQAGNYLLYDILQSVSAGKSSRAGGERAHSYQLKKYFQKMGRKFEVGEPRETWKIGVAGLRNHWGVLFQRREYRKCRVRF